MNSSLDKGNEGARDAGADSTLSPLPGEAGIPSVASSARSSVSVKGLVAVVLLILLVVGVAVLGIQRFAGTGKKTDEASSKRVGDRPAAATGEPRRLELPTAPAASAPLVRRRRSPTVSGIAAKVAASVNRASSPRTIISISDRM